ncbi:MAG: cobalamin-dependent protein, partial [Bacteroidota bacterium]
GCLIDSDLDTRTGLPLTSTVSLLTTRDAALLLGVHESSVKRWCADGDLLCVFTPGGHRRLHVPDLSAFADVRALNFALRPFGPAAEHVWDGYRQARRGDFRPLSTVLYDLLGHGRTALVTDLFAFLGARSFALPTLLDRVLAPTMRRIGQAYAKGRLSIGDEHFRTHLVRDALVTMHLDVQAGRPDAQRPHAGVPARPVAVVGCARSEAHELGALMVRLLLEDQGWHVVYLGLNVPTEEFARQQRQHRAHLVCISMMPPTGTPEAHVIADVLGRLYDGAHPYHLVFGGAAVHTSVRTRARGAPHLDIQVFNAMTAFAEWVGALDDLPVRPRP